MGARKPLFEVRRSSIQGRGAFALRPIRAGTRITEYTGERISNDEADQRYDDARTKRHHTFLFALADDTTIDATHIGNDSRFINHSCDPNCEASEEDGRIFIYALTDIEPEDELTYDYQYVTDDQYDDDMLRRLYPCRCGTAKCRGTLAALRKKPSKKAAAKSAKKSAKKATARGERTA